MYEPPPETDDLPIIWKAMFCDATHGVHTSYSPLEVRTSHSTRFWAILPLASEEGRIRSTIWRSSITLCD